MVMSYSFDRSTLSHEGARLLDSLLGHVNEIGRAQVPTAVLLKDTGLTQGALVRARSELTTSSLLRTEPGYSNSGLRGANVYVLNMVALEPPSSLLPEGETGRSEAEEPVVPAQRPSSEPMTSSGRHRAERKSLWSRFFGGKTAS